MAVQILRALALLTLSGSVAHAEVVSQDLRRLLQRGKYKEAAALAASLPPAPSLLSSPGSAGAASDRALAAWLASDGGDAAAARATEVFLGIAVDVSLPGEVRLAACRNAAHLEGTRDGSRAGWSNFDAAYGYDKSTTELFQALLVEGVEGRASQGLNWTEVG